MCTLLSGARADRGNGRLKFNYDGGESAEWSIHRTRCVKETKTALTGSGVPSRSVCPRRDDDDDVDDETACAVLSLFVRFEIYGLLMLYTRSHEIHDFQRFSAGNSCCCTVRTR